MIAYLLERVLRNDHPAYKLLHPLADRISLNREVMGLHYRSDSEAGVKLACKFNQFLDERIQDKDLLLTQTIAAARKEWASYGNENPVAPGTEPYDAPKAEPDQAGLTS